MERRDVSTRNGQDPKRENFLSDKKALICGPILPEFQDSVKSSKDGFFLRILGQDFMHSASIYR